MTADLVYLANFLKPSIKIKIYPTFYQKKFLILARASHLAQLTSPTLRKIPHAWPKKKQIFRTKINSYNQRISDKRSLLEVFCTKGFLKNFRKFTLTHLC